MLLESHFHEYSCTSTFIPLNLFTVHILQSIHFLKSRDLLRRLHWPLAKENIEKQQQQIGSKDCWLLNLCRIADRVQNKVVFRQNSAKIETELKEKIRIVSLT